MLLFGDTVVSSAKCFRERNPLVCCYRCSGSTWERWAGLVCRLTLFPLQVSYPHSAVPHPSKPGDISFPRGDGHGWGEAGGLHKAGDGVSSP